MPDAQRTPPFESLRPVRNRRYEAGSDGRVTLLVPKFTHPVLVRWFVPLLRRRDVRVRLDEQGSFVWQQCDGETTVREIAARVAATYGGDTEAVLSRVAKFLAQLSRGETVTFLAPAGPQGDVPDGG